MAHQPLSGKTALITGGSKGIGAATATHLSSLGAKIVLTYSTSSAPAEALVTRLGGPTRALAIRADASSLPDIERLIASTTAFSGGSIDILIPNAGVMAMSSVAHTTEAQFDATYELNVKGPYFLVQKALPYLRPGARVVFLSTSLCASSTVAPDYLLYVSSKGAVEQMTRVLAKDLGGRGINVNAVAPGPTATELFLEGKPQQVIDNIASLNPFKRIGEPDEIAKAIAYLSGDGGSWVNGQILRVNGGMTVGN
ncbi:NAD(P)-binding protein [Pyrenochaeta sp. DS3sAY3a]|nr:NAD(P)-binding protein [Pyrenochaeta sp. DS3sAY3a]